MSPLKSLKTICKKRKIILVGLLALIASYLVFCADFYIRQESYLFEPKKDPTDMSESTHKGRGKEFTLPKIQGDDREIHYRIYTTATMPSKGTVLYLHGNRGDMDRCEFEIDFLIDRGYDVWTMDYRGYGESLGTVSERALKEDAKAIFDKIADEDSAKPIIIWGRSFGSGVAASVAAAADHKPEMLILETPYWSLVDLVRQKCPIIPSVLFRYELPIHEFLMSAGCPIHLIHGTQDEKIHSNASDRLLELCKFNSIDVKGHSIMCGMHNLRNKKTIDDFEEKAASILK